MKQLGVWLRAALAVLKLYLPLRPNQASRPVTNRAQLREFLHTRASHVAQSALYGYLRTRAGMRYPELFDNDDFVRSVNICKWYVWLACVSDLCVYSGGLLARRYPGPEHEVAVLMQSVVEELLADIGIPADAGGAFAQHVERLRSRITGCAWSSVSDDESAFIESPSALVQHAPIVEELMQLDEPIVRNSVRFRWHQVRRELRGQLDAQAVMVSQRK